MRARFTRSEGTRDAQEATFYSTGRTVAITRRRDEPRSVFCFLFLLNLSLFPLLRRRRRHVSPLRSRGSDCSRETGGAARSTNGVPAFTERHLAPTRAQRGRRPSGRGNARPCARRRFHPCATTTPTPPRRCYYPSGGGSTRVLRLRSFAVLTFDIGGFMAELNAGRAARISRIVFLT